MPRKASLASKIRPDASATLMPMTPDSASRRNRISLTWSARSAALRACLASASRSSLSTAGTRRASLFFTMKSWAPAFSAATAVSSPMVPETMMMGRSRSRSRTRATAPGASKVGSE